MTGKEGGSLPTNWKSKKKKGARLLAEGALLVTEAALLAAEGVSWQRPLPATLIGVTTKKPMQSLKMNRTTST